MRRILLLHIRLPQWLRGEESDCNTGGAGDTVSIPGSGRSPGGGNGNLLQYSSWKMQMDSPQGHKESDTTEWQYTLCIKGFPSDTTVKNPPANVGDEGDKGMTSGSGRSRNTGSSILAWKIPWTEEPGGLQSMESQRVDTTELTHMAHKHKLIIRILSSRVLILSLYTICMIYDLYIYF